MGGLPLNMNAAGRGAACAVLCAQVLLLGTTAGDHLTVYRSVINVTIGHAVLLPVAFTLTDQFSKFSVEWEVGNRSILYHMALNCTLDSRGSPTWISDDAFVVYPAYISRVQFYKMNSSLLIHKVQANDSGTYRITFSTTRLTTTQHITIRVLMEQPPGSAAASTWKLWIFAFWKLLCLFPLAALLITFHVWG